MISAVLISPDAELSGQLERILAEIGQVAVVRNLKHYPAEQDLERLIRALAPQLFFLDSGSLEEALRVAAVVDAQAIGTQIVAIDRVCDQRRLIELMRAGIREFLALPFDPNSIVQSLSRLGEALERKPPAVESTDQVLAFLPSKPGVGCSTLALNAAIALGALPDTRTLLVDFDLNCGVIGFLLQLGVSPSLVDAAEHSARLDEVLWPKLVRRAGNVDVIPAGRPNPGFRIECTQIRYIIEFARRNYNVICADLSGLMEKYSVEVMQEAKRICLVCTPEVPSLYLAREKIELLRSLELEDRVMVLVNRSHKRQTIARKQIESTLGLPVAMELPNDYRGVNEALGEARPVHPGSDLGKRISELARRFLSREVPERKPRRFVDYFSITPGAYSFDPASRKP